MDLKVECERILTLCQGCLSADRQLSCITGHNKMLFIKLRDLIQTENDTKDLLLCWECVALLNKMKHFQARIKTAQYRLVQYLQTYYVKNDIPHTLSLLIKTKNKEHDYNFIYEEDQKELIIEQNDQIIEQNDQISEQKDQIFEQKGQIFEQKDQIFDIKLENGEMIKEEYDNDNISINNDSDYYQPELKQETNEDFPVPYQNTKKRNRKPQIKSIKKYATLCKVTKTNSLFSNVTQYYTTVFVSSKKVELSFIGKQKYKYDKNMPYRCELCKIGYNMRLDFLRHNTFHHNKQQFPTACLSCKREITSESHLGEHWKDYHNSMLKCSLCGELSRTKGEVKKHLNRSHTKKFTCNKCSLEFRTLREFSNHYKTAHERVVCDYCNKSYCSKKLLEGHIKRNHLPHHCSICNRDFRAYYLLEAHLKRLHPELIPSFKRKETDKELRYCVECDKQFSTVHKYKAHLKQSVRHEPPKKIRVPCPACDKIFTRVSYKNNHYRLVHSQNSKNYCELCDKYFATGFGVRKHIERVHQKVPMPKDKICDLCGRGFSVNSNLIKHRRTHTGERPYKCQYCPAAFAQRTAMKTHQKTQHKNIVLSN